MAIMAEGGRARSRRPRTLILRSRSSGAASIAIQVLASAVWREVLKETWPGCVPCVEQYVERASAMYSVELARAAGLGS